MTGPYYTESFSSEHDDLDPTFGTIVDGRNGVHYTLDRALVLVLNKIDAIETKVQEGLAQIDPVMTQLRPMLTMMGL